MPAITHEVNETQALIMRQLFAHETLRFSEINSEEIPSDQLSYHLRQLIKHGLVEKSEDSRYTLSVKGRSQAVLLDSRSDAFINQGFVACRVILSRLHDGQKQYLVQRRKKVPYHGYLCEPGGKIAFGEDVIASAQRNMLAETGLTCDMAVRGLAHFKDNYEERIVQDKFFFIITATNPTGKLLSSGSTGENIWLTLSEIANDPKTHKGVLDMIRITENQGQGQDQSNWFLETTYVMSEY